MVAGTKLSVQGVVRRRDVPEGRCFGEGMPWWGASAATGRAQQCPQRGRGQDAVPVTAQVGFPGREVLCHHHQHESGCRSQPRQRKLNTQSHRQHLSPPGPLLGTRAFAKVGTAALPLLLSCIFPWECRNSWEPGMRMGIPGCPGAAGAGHGAAHADLPSKTVSSLSPV